MTIGHPDSRVSYPDGQAFYPVSVRQNKCSPTASFRFPVARDTLAFGFKIPVITALSGLGNAFPHLLDLQHARHTSYLALPEPLYFKNIEGSKA